MNTTIEIKDIPKDNPFLNCKLGRKVYAEVLTDIVKTNPNGFVLAIDNKWGTGKTTFVTMWRYMLENEDNGFKTLYFNAWENDFENNPFVALTAELKSLLKNESSDAFKEVVKKGGEIAKASIPSIIKTFIKRYGGEDLADIIADTSEGVFEAFKDDIDSYVQRKSSIKDFQNQLQDYIEENSNDKPVIFIIDELDRCRPNYAVSVLENIKHLFAVKGIVFVLSIDKAQLGHAICGVYGSDQIDSIEYLRRFIDIEYSLPKPEIKNYVLTLIDSCGLNEFFNRETREQNELKKEKSGFIEFACFLFEFKNLNLRQQEKLMIHVGITLKAFNEQAYIYPELLLFLIYLRLFEQNFYEQIRRKELSHQELLDKNGEVLKGNLNENTGNRIRIKIEAYLLICYNHYLDYHGEISLKQNENQDFPVNSHFDNNNDDSEFIYHIQAELNNMRRDLPSIDYLLKKIDLLETINFY